MGRPTANHCEGEPLRQTVGRQEDLRFAARFVRRAASTAWWRSPDSGQGEAMKATRRTLPEALKSLCSSKSHEGVEHILRLMMLFVPWEAIPRKVDNRLYIELTTIHHTYGDPVRGSVHFENVRKVFIEALELKFSGECGTNIRYPIKRQVWTRFGPAEQIYYRKATDKKTLFQESRTIANGVHLEAGHHQWPYEFHFPEREEVDLGPNAEPFTVADYFWIRYELAGATTFIDSNHTKGTLKALRYPTFLDSRRSSISGPPISSEFALSRRPSVAERLPNSIRRTSTAVETFRLVLNTPSVIITNEPLPLTLTISDTTDGDSGSTTSDASRSWRLMKFKMYLKYKIRLTAQMHMVSVDLGKAEAVEVCTYSAKKGTDVPTFSSNEAFELGQKLSIRTPKGIRPTFRNELVDFEHFFKVTLELERDGRTYNAKFADIMVEVQPHYIQESLPAFHEATDIPPPPFTPSAEPATGASPAGAAGAALSRSHTVTPPPTFDHERASDLEEEGLEPVRRSSWSPL